MKSKAFLSPLMLTPTAQTPKGEHATSNHGLIEDKDKVEVLEVVG